MNRKLPLLLMLLITQAPIFSTEHKEATENDKQQAKLIAFDIQKMLVLH